MKIKAVLNRDGGTFKTTDMQTYCENANRAFAARGHELDCTVVRIAVVVVEAVQDAVPLAEALLAGGIGIIEITLRTPQALEAAARVAKAVPGIVSRAR